MFFNKYPEATAYKKLSAALRDEAKKLLSIDDDSMGFRERKESVCRLVTELSDQLKEKILV